MKQAICLAFSLIAVLATSGNAQQASAEHIARLLVQDLSPTGKMEGGQWFTNADANSGRATQALGIIYVHVPGSAGTVSIHAGVYGYFDSGWVKLKNVDGLFGFDPKDARFLPGRVELSTLTLGPGEPRCCPTVRARWSIDLASGVSTRLP